MPVTDPSTVWVDSTPVAKSGVRGLISETQTNIAAETTAREAAITAVETLVDDEATARAAGDDEQAVALAAEVDERRSVILVQDGDVLRVVDSAGWIVAEIGVEGIAHGGWSLLSGDDGALRITDPYGFVSHLFRPGNLLPTDAVKMWHAPGTGYALRIIDVNGWVGFAIDNAGGVAMNVEGSVDDLSSRDAVNLASSAAVARAINPIVQRPVAKYNHVITYGQSLASGWEGWPAISRTAYGGNLMLGDSVRPTSRTAAEFVPLNTATFEPMVAVVQDTSTGAILSDAAVAALNPVAGNEGESVDVGALNLFRRLFLAHYGLAADATRLMVASNCGVGGMTIEELSKGASPELYQRVIDAATIAKGIADGESASYAIPAILWLQGEWNYRSEEGGTTTKAGYKAALQALYDDLLADVIDGIAGQAAPPAFITYQTGGSFTRDDNDLAIGMAQLELAEENANWFLAAPSYPVTDKGGHLDPNGYRWLGMQFGKVLHRVLTLGQDWKPLSPIRATRLGRQILIDFHVPEPPLVFDAAYVEFVATDYAAKGFAVFDDDDDAEIYSVEIVGQTMVRITLAADPSGVVKVQYATKTLTNGNGCLRDSDPTLSPDVYEYTPGTGMFAESNLPELVDQPYPLHNWCVAFSLIAIAE